MLATAWPQPFSDDDWLFEEKVDGFRMLLYWDGTGVELRSRSGRDVTPLYPELVTFAAQRPCVLDGEAVVRDADGTPRFELMQHRTGVPSPASILDEYPVEFVVFDVLFDDGDITGRGIEDRRLHLDSIAGDLTVSSVVEGDGEGLWRTVETRGLEGMMAKRRGSAYTSGRRADTWRKIARTLSVRTVVGGFTLGDGGRSSTFGSLQVGLWRGDALQWVGSVGTGFSDSTLVAIRSALDEQVTEVSPFHPDPDLPEGVRWVEPSLVAMVGIKEWTRHDRMRAPRFLGFSDDDPMTVTWESER